VCVCRRGTLVSFFARGSWDSQSVCVEFIALTSSSKREREQITINRPERRNAFRPLTVMELKRAFDYARDDPEVGVVIFTGKVLAKSCSSFPILHSLLQPSPLSLCLSDPLSLFLSLSLSYLSFVLDKAVSQSVTEVLQLNTLLSFSLFFDCRCL
jgi:hypothetical protein